MLEPAYVAGLIDGEGSIGINKTWKDTYAVRVCVGMSVVAEQVILALQESYGGRVSPMKPDNERCCPKLRWAAEGELAIAVLELIYPFLILKRPQAEVAFRLQDLIRAGKALSGRQFWTEAWREQAAHLKAEIGQLNQRGPASVAALSKAS
jgi:hypothetical protein